MTRRTTLRIGAITLLVLLLHGCSAAPNGASSSDSGVGAHRTISLPDTGVQATHVAAPSADAGSGNPGARDAGSSGVHLDGSPKRDASGTTSPSPAAAVGYNTQTFGPNVTLGTDWSVFAFFGVDTASVGATQNGDGSVTITGGGDDYGAQLSTTSPSGVSPYFTGTTFGGGAYFEATMAFDGPASFWANDVESQAGGSGGDVTLRQWPGQAAGYGDWIECDFAEFDTTGVYGFAMHNWYGTGDSPMATSTLNSGSPASPAGADYTQPNKYGFLWVPATSTAQGYAQWFFNDVQVGNTMTWNQYDPSKPPPPLQTDGTAYSVLDTRHLSLILGGTPGATNTVYAVSVWQATAANNLVR